MDSIKIVTLGQVILEARQRAGLTQRQLAACVKKEDGRNVSGVFINDIEHNYRIGSDLVLEQIAQTLNLSPDYLYHLAGKLPADIRNFRTTNEIAQRAYTKLREELARGQELITQNNPK